MSRKITQQAVTAFLQDRPLSIGNTTVSVKWAYTRLYLHANEIAWKKCNIDKDKSIRITNDWYKTNVTKERLNGIPWVHIVQKNHAWYLNGIVQKNHVWYLNGTEWNGEWTKI